MSGVGKKSTSKKRKSEKVANEPLTPDELAEQYSMLGDVGYQFTNDDTLFAHVGIKDGNILDKTQKKRYERRHTLAEMEKPWLGPMAAAMDTDDFFDLHKKVDEYMYNSHGEDCFDKDKRKQSDYMDVLTYDDLIEKEYNSREERWLEDLALDAASMIAQTVDPPKAAIRFIERVEGRVVGMMRRDKINDKRFALSTRFIKMESSIEEEKKKEST